MKCPSCGTNSKNGTVICPKCGRYCGRTFANKNEDVFSSFSRAPANGGYTQQKQQKKSVQYTGEVSVANRSDDMFFSAEKRNEELERDNRQIVVEEHDSEINPYDEDKYGKKDELPHYAPGEKQPHTTEFVPQSIVQFKNHRFGKPLADKIEFILAGLVLLVFLAIPVDLEVEKSVLSISIISFHTFFITLLAFITQKTYSRITASAIAVYVLLYSIAMIFLSKPITFAADDIILYLGVYCFVSAQLIVCLRLMFKVSAYNDTWEVYQKRNTVSVKFDSSAIKMFTSETRNPTNSGYTQSADRNNPAVNPYDEMFVNMQNDKPAEDESFADMHTDKPAETETETAGNPYDSIYEEKNAPSTYGDSSKGQPHETEFLPTNIAEFSRHIFGRPIAKKIKNSLYSMIALAVFSILVDLCMDASKASVPLMFMHTAILVWFTFYIKKNYTKKSAHLLLGYMIACSTAMGASAKALWYHSYDMVAFFMLYLTFMAQVVFCMRMLLAVYKYHELWNFHTESGRIPLPENDLK